VPTTYGSSRWFAPDREVIAEIGDYLKVDDERIVAAEYHTVGCVVGITRDLSLDQR
jgi:hypothetical protein